MYAWGRALRGEFCADFLDHHGAALGHRPAPRADDRLDLGCFQRAKAREFRKRVEAHYSKESRRARNVRHATLARTLFFSSSLKSAPRNPRATRTFRAPLCFCRPGIHRGPCFQSAGWNLLGVVAVGMVEEELVAVEVDESESSSTRKLLLLLLFYCLLTK